MGGGSGDEQPPASSPARPAGAATADLTRLADDHTATRVRVTATVRAVARDWNLVESVVTPRARYRVLLAEIGGTPYVVLSRRGRAVRCPRLGRAVDPAAGTLRVTVPRACLGTPAWVRVGAVMTARSAGGAPVADDAQLAGRLRDDGSPKPGGRVSAG